MIRKVADLVLAFDCEWVPDPIAARLLFPECATADAPEAIKQLWASNGATEENPTPFIKLIQSRVVSIAMVTRRAKPGEPAQLKLSWLPRNPDLASDRVESDIIGKFLTGIGRSHPQLVGFNSKNADCRILAQRAYILGIPAPGFLHRPNKPWEGDDYFARDTDCHIDLMDCLSGFGRSISLHDAAAISGIPGKFGTHGDMVWEMWQQGQFKEIVQYNCFDAITTYLVWLRTAWVSGLFTNDQYQDEQELVRELLMDLCDKPETAYLEAYIHEWDRLQTIHQSYQA